VVNFTRRKQRRNPLNWRLGGPQKGSGRFGESCRCRDSKNSYRQPRSLFIIRLPAKNTNLSSFFCKITPSKHEPAFMYSSKRPNWLWGLPCGYRDLFLGRGGAPDHSPHPVTRWIIELYYVCVYVTRSATTLPSRYSDALRARRSGHRIPVEAWFSSAVKTGPGTHPASCMMGTGSLSRGKSGQGVALTTHQHLPPRLKKE
jgi:hypothetical protein